MCSKRYCHGTPRYNYRNAALYLARLTFSDEKLDVVYLLTLYELDKDHQTKLQRPTLVNTDRLCGRVVWGGGGVNLVTYSYHMLRFMTSLRLHTKLLTINMGWGKGYPNGTVPNGKYKQDQKRTKCVPCCISSLRY